MPLSDAIDRLLGRRTTPPPLDLPPVRTAADLLADLEEFEAGVRPRVPPAIAARVGQVTKIVRETIPRLDQLGAGSYQAHTVMATASSYLPETVNTYLRLPPDFANRRPVKGAKTALMVVVDDLDILTREMDKMYDAVCRADITALLAHSAFLAEKFDADSQLDLGGSIVAPPQPPDNPGGPVRLRPPGDS